MEEIKDTEEISRIEKISRQIELPRKPKFGSVGRWILFGIGLLLTVWGATRNGMEGMASTNDQSQWNLIFSIPFAVLTLIVLVEIVLGYFAKKREYEFSRTNEQEYRLYKTMEFLKQNEQNKEYSELLRDFAKDYPKMIEHMEAKKRFNFGYWGIWS